MALYSYAEARERLSALLERALAEGQVKFRSRDGGVFIIRRHSGKSSKVFVKDKCTQHSVYRTGGYAPAN
jgi:hypothetical protein